MCAKKEVVDKYIDIIEYSSWVVMIFSVFPCKIIGLELMGVLQLNYLSLSSVNTLNPLMSSFASLSSVNGFKMLIDNR